MRTEDIGTVAAAAYDVVEEQNEGSKLVSSIERAEENVRMSPSGSSPRNRWRRWRWVLPAIVILSGIVNLINPQLHPGLRMVWMFVLLPIAVILCAYYLYANYRERRSPRHPSNGT